MEPREIVDTEDDRIRDESAEASCPYCGELVELILDTGGAASQQYVEDCEVCCRPWVVYVDWTEDGIANVDLRTQDDA